MNWHKHKETIPKVCNKPHSNIMKPQWQTGTLIRYINKEQTSEPLNNFSVDETT